MRFFLILCGDGEIRLSPLAELDKPGEQGLVLTPALPLALLSDTLKSLGLTSEWLATARQTLAPHLLQDIVQAVRSRVGQGDFGFEWREAGQPPDEQVGDGESYRDFSRRVQGRQLTGGDLNHLAQEMGVGPEQVRRWADQVVRQHQAGWFPAVMKEGRIWRCRRCGEEAEEWPGLYGAAATCRSCASLGASTSLEALYCDYRSLAGDAPWKYDFAPHWALTPAQQEAAEEVLEFVERMEKREALVWAACGAGKTEMCFPAIDWALSRGIPVLFAAPRQDVVHDVAPRLQRDFRGLPIQVLSGHVQVHYAPGPLVLATTHQILRFYRAFGLIFLDEMDAFPYAGNHMLAWGLKQALAAGGKLVYLSATPSQEYLHRAAKGQIRLIRLPARHHRKPVPVPSWERMAFKQGISGCPQRLLTKLGDLAERGPVLVFVPKISWVEPTLAALRRCLPHLSSEGSHSADPERQEKIAGLRQGRYRLFVTTSILERGVTLRGVQVVVLAADHPVFDERALVQMAGRVGRTEDCPDGQVIFFAGREASSLKTARHWIEEQNRLAQARGLLDPG